MSKQIIGQPGRLASLALKQVKTGVLDVGYFDNGASDGPPVLLLHGSPYDIHSYVDVAPVRAARGRRVLVPHLRGHGTTRFLESGTPRSGQQASIGADVIALMDALNVPRALVAAMTGVAERLCGRRALAGTMHGLVSVNSYLIQDIATAALPVAAKIEAGFWYQYYFQTERGRAGLSAHRWTAARPCSRNRRGRSRQWDRYRRAAVSTEPTAEAHRRSTVRDRVSRSGREGLCVHVRLIHTGHSTLTTQNSSARPKGTIGIGEGIDFGGR